MKTKLNLIGIITLTLACVQSASALVPVSAPMRSSALLLGGGFLAILAVRRWLGGKR